MNGTLISHLPGGGGSGASVTNGGPARVKSIASKQTMLIAAQQSFINLPEGPIQRGIYLCVTLRMRPAARSIRYRLRLRSRCYWPVPTIFLVNGHKQSSETTPLAPGKGIG